MHILYIIQIQYNIIEQIIYHIEKKIKMNYQQFISYFLSIGQQHIVQKAQQASQQQKIILLEQVNYLEKIYPGGLASYVERAKKLLNDSKNNINPYEGFIPSVPHGINLDFYNQQQINYYQKLGESQLKHTGFVLVAGGLGQRLGYNGIKVQIPIDLATRTCFLKYYIQYILAIEKRFCAEDQFIPFAIMTSDDTKKLTQVLLEKNNYFGMKQYQITIMKQEKVPSMLDNNARFALQSNRLLIQTKPHGHGDVHTLLYQHKLTKSWQKLPNKIKWVVFFQDTNALIFRSISAIIGVSRQKNYEMNSVGVLRKPGQMVGSITRLANSQNKELVINVEYNQLQGLLKNLGGQQVDKDGNSVYPGNINVLVLELEKYDQVLQKTGGSISQFINPKYTDTTKTKFKSPARLECMMQDYPKLLSTSKNVGFTVINRKFCFSTVKNDIKSASDKYKNHLAPECSSSCQADFYFLNRQLLRISGAEIQQGDQMEYAGIRVRLFPIVFLHPSFGINLRQIRKKVRKLTITKNSILIVNNDCILQDVNVDGTLVINQQGPIITSEHSKNYIKLIPINENDPGYLQIRGYKMHK